jgi:hypothetical protein
MADIRQELALRSGRPSFFRLCAEFDRSDERAHRPVQFLRRLAPHIPLADSVIMDWNTICLLLEPPCPAPMPQESELVLSL